VIDGNEVASIYHYSYYKNLSVHNELFAVEEA
jgi:hypothetical protein